jgi:Family of unknown function (DUF6599)
MKFFAFLCTPLILASVGLGAQRNVTFIDLASQPKWQMESSETLDLNEARQWGDEPAVDREYGVKSVELRTYREGKETALAIVESAPDPSSAYGLFTFYQNETMTPAKGMKLAVMSPEQGYMARGTAFVRVLRPAKMSDQDFRALLLSIGGASPSAQAMDLLPPPLPAKDIVPGSEKYVLGPLAASRAIPSFRTDLVGFQQSAELQTAAYVIDGHRVNFFLISYPTLQIANLRYRSLMNLVHQANGPGSLYGKLMGTYVLLVQNAPSRQLANNLMDRLTVSQELSWNEPAPGSPITVQVFHLILGNMLLVLILVAMALGAGVLVFIARRLAAKWFPQFQWARAYEDSIIRLNLK